jgi:hypothetical protein
MLFHRRAANSVRRLRLVGRCSAKTKSDLKVKTLFEGPERVSKEHTSLPQR